MLCKLEQKGNRPWLGSSLSALVSKTGNDLTSLLGNALLRTRDKFRNEPEEGKEEFTVSDFVVFFHSSSFFPAPKPAFSKIYAEVVVSILGQTDHWN